MIKENRLPLSLQFLSITINTVFCGYYIVNYFEIIKFSSQSLHKKDLNINELVQ